MPRLSSSPSLPDPATDNDTIERIEAMLAEARKGNVPNFAACLFFADGSSVKFVAGQSLEEECQALALLQARLATGN